MSETDWYNDVAWRGRIVAECATLERWYVFRGIEGSNPSLSARRKVTILQGIVIFLLEKKIRITGSAQ